MHATHFRDVLGPSTPPTKTKAQCTVTMTYLLSSYRRLPRPLIPEVQYEQLLSIGHAELEGSDDLPNPNPNPRPNPNPNPDPNPNPKP